MKMRAETQCPAVLLLASGDTLEGGEFGRMRILLDRLGVFLIVRSVEIYDSPDHLLV